MVRRGTFGRLPTPQPSIDNTLAAIGRARQSRRDSNIMDAWKNGGEFEGKAVTDDDVLAYWQQRMANLSSTDPQYDTYKDQVMQLQYGIEQSKQDLLHVQGKISDTQYAQFFIDWAAKVPQGSEFWRTLQKDAAQLIESAKTAGRAGAEASRTKAWNDFVAQQNKTTDVGDALTADLYALAKEKYPGDPYAAIADHSDELLADLTQDAKDHPEKHRLLIDATKVAVPGFDGQYTSAFATTWISASEQGWGNIATRAKSEGRTSDYAAAAKNQSASASWETDTRVWPVTKSYDAAKARFDSVWTDPNATNKDKADAAREFGITLTDLSRTAGLDPVIKDMLREEGTRALTGESTSAPTFGDGVVGHGGVTPEQGATVANINNAQSVMDSSQPGQYVYASAKPDGTYDDTGKSPIGVVYAGSLPADAIGVMIPGGDGKVRMTYVVPQTVSAENPNDLSGKTIPVGGKITYQIGGKTVTMYGYKDSGGVQRWTTSWPYADGVTQKLDSKGNVVLTLPGSNPLGQAALIDKQYGTNISALLLDEKGNPRVLPAGGDLKTVYEEKDPVTHTVISRTTVTYNVDTGKFTATKAGITTNADLSTSETATTSLAIPTATGNTGTIAQDVIAGSRFVVTVPPPDTTDSPLTLSMGESDTAGVSTSAQVNDPEFQAQWLLQFSRSHGVTDLNDPNIRDAWNNLNQDVAWSSGPAGGPGGEHGAIASTDKTGLNYPGTKTPDLHAGQVNITFSDKSIKVPGLPGGESSAPLFMPALGRFPGVKAGGPGGESGAIAPTPAGSQTPPASGPVVQTTVTPIQIGEGNQDITPSRIKPSGVIPTTITSPTASTAVTPIRKRMV